MCVCGCVRAWVCVSARRLLVICGMTWLDMIPYFCLNKSYILNMVAIVGIIDGCDFSNDEHCRSQPNRIDIMLYKSSICYNETDVHK